MRHILRAGYVQHRARKTIRVTRKDGTTYTFIRKAGTSIVRPVPIKDVGAVGKSPKVIGNLKSGMLTMYGYHPVEAMTNRHKSLAKAIRVGREDPHAVVKRLTAISTLTKRTLPRASRIYKADARWVHEKYAKTFGRK
jgi:hypothetical protein